MIYIPNVIQNIINNILNMKIIKKFIKTLYLIKKFENINNRYYWNRNSNRRI